MITLTFEEYDELVEKVEGIEVSEDYILPDIEKVKELLKQECEGLEKILIALKNATDKQYKKEINQILYEELYLISKENYLESFAVEKKTNKFEATRENLEKISKIVNSMEFTPIYYFPTKERLKTFVKGKSEEELAFLMWLISTKMELTKEEKECYNYALSFIQKKMALSA